MQSVIKSLILLAGFSLVVSGCVLKPPATDTNQKANQPANTNEVMEIDTSDWKTYRNEEYGFSLKYPFSWHLDDCYKQYGFDTTLVMLADVAVACKGNPEDAKISILVTDNRKYGNWPSRLENYQEENILIDGRESQKVIGDLAYKNAEGDVMANVWIRIADTYLPINDKGNYLVLRFHRSYNSLTDINSLEEDLEVYNKFIVSFKFAQ